MHPNARNECQTIFARNDDRLFCGCWIRSDVDPFFWTRGEATGSTANEVAPIVLASKMPCFMAPIVVAPGGFRFVVETARGWRPATFQHASEIGPGGVGHVTIVTSIADVCQVGQPLGYDVTWPGLAGLIWLGINPACFAISFKFKLWFLRNVKIHILVKRLTKRKAQLFLWQSWWMQYFRQSWVLSCSCKSMWTSI